MELMNIPQIRSIAIIAEAVPERRARESMVMAKGKGILRRLFLPSSRHLHWIRV